MAVAGGEQQVESDVTLGASPPSSRPTRRAGLSLRRRVLLAVLFVATLAGLGAYGATFLVRNRVPQQAPSAIIRDAARGELLVTVTENGSVESASNVEIKCRVAGGSSILSIVEDGKQVKKGEKLVELDKSKIEDQINAQKITFEKARSALVQAEKDRQVAEISVKEYLEGTYTKDLQDKETTITIATENVRTAQNALANTQLMFRQGYVSQLELEGQQFSVQRAQLELDSAQTAKEVLEKFTKVKMLEDLRSKVATAQARMEAEKASFALEEGKLKRLTDQLAACVINAPQDGMVVYANEQSPHMRGGTQQGPQIAEGAQVRERQTILRLPDLSQMQVKATVHESKVDSIKSGMRARIRIQERDYQGSVASVASQPEPPNFFAGNTKEYATIVRIEGETQGLRPGMTAEVEILVARLDNVLMLPITSVVELRGEFCCWVQRGKMVERRPLVLGLNNEQSVEVKDGISQGDGVVVNPRAAVPEARGDAGETEQIDPEKTFGEKKPVS